MATKPLPDQALLLKLLRYEPETGKLFWLERGPDMFAATSHPEGQCASFNARYAGQEAFTADNGRGYLIGGIAGFQALRAHRVIWCMVYGYWPLWIDHKNQNKTDNRLANLREATREENGRNSRLGSRNVSGRIGVHWLKRIRRWRVRIRHNGRYIDVGLFVDFEEACQARSGVEVRFGYSPLHGKRHAISGASE